MVAAVIVIAAAALAGAFLSQSRSVSNAASAVQPAPVPESPNPIQATPIPSPLPIPDVPTPKPTPFETVIMVNSRDGLVIARTVPGSTCRLAGTLPNGSPFAAPGMEKPILADGSGTVSWDYTSAVTSSGGTHTITCTISGLTASASAAFVGGS